VWGERRNRVEAVQRKVFGKISSRQLTSMVKTEGEKRGGSRMERRAKWRKPEQTSDSRRQRRDFQSSLSSRIPMASLEGHGGWDLVLASLHNTTKILHSHPLDILGLE